MRARFQMIVQAIGRAGSMLRWLAIVAIWYALLIVMIMSGLVFLYDLSRETLRALPVIEITFEWFFRVASAIVFFFGGLFLFLVSLHIHQARAEMVVYLCRSLLLIVGVIGFLIHMHETFSDQTALEKWIRQSQEHSVILMREGGYLKDLERLTGKNLFENAHAWMSWYYSPLNLFYWWLAMLYLFPAFACHLILQYLTWQKVRVMSRGG